jgi:predicted  nucleic acid-binding Zn-ribbon protein
MASTLQSIKEEGRANLAQSREENRAEFARFGEKVGNLSDQIRKTTEEIMALNEKIKEGFNEVKEELGSMIKFSYADLEKRFGTLKARLKALEKLVLP